MDPVALALIAFACTSGAALAGIWLRTALPDHLLGADAKDVVRLASGLVATMAALLLGLLVASAKDSFDAEKGEVVQMAAKVGYLDRVLTAFGPETAPSRAMLRTGVQRAIDAMWPTDPSRAQIDPADSRGDALHAAIHALAPQTETQRSLKEEAVGLVAGLGQMRWQLFAQAGSSISKPMLLVVISWLAIIFVSFGLFAPANRTVIASLLVSALSVAAAIFLILELDQPFGGVIQISSEPMLKALRHLAK